jgi:hypothetical protein
MKLMTVFRGSTLNMTDCTGCSTETVQPNTCPTKLSNAVTFMALFPLTTNWRVRSPVKPFAGDLPDECLQSNKKEEH